MTHHLRTVAIVVLAVGLVVFFLLGVNLEEVWGEMRGGHTGFLLLASLMQALFTYSVLGVGDCCFDRLAGFDMVLLFARP